MKKIHNRDLRVGTKVYLPATEDCPRQRVEIIEAEDNDTVMGEILEADREGDDDGLVEWAGSDYEYYETWK